MTGVQEYNNTFKNRCEKAIEENKEIEYLEDFYLSMNDNGNSTKYQYISHVINFAKFIGNKKAKDITLADYTRYLASIDSTSAAHQKTTYAALRKLSAFMGEYGLGVDCVTKKIKTKAKESSVTIKKREKAFLTEEEIDQLIDYVRNYDDDKIWIQRDIAIISVFRTGGIRRAALQKLDVDNIDFEEETIEVTEKGDKPRIVYLTSDTMDEVNKWMEYRNSLNPNTNALFVSRRNNRMDMSNINYMFAKYGKIFPGKRMSPHKLRASYGTTLYNKTHDIFFVQKAMGHSAPSVTEIYIRGQENPTKEARDILAKRRKEGK